MDDDHFRYTVEAFDNQGRAIGRGFVQPDWYPVLEAARFQALRAGRTPAAPVCERVTPVWDEETGPPCAAAVRAVVLGADGEGPSQVEVPALPLFRQLAQAVGSELVSQGALKDGETFQYRVAAYPHEPDISVNGSRDHRAFAIEDVAAPSPVAGVRSLSEYVSRSTPCGCASDEDYPVFIPARVLSESAALKDAGGEQECGGVLIGHMWRDSDSPYDVFAEVTALIPAQHTVATATQLTFTADTWAAVDAAIRLRRRGEAYLGWQHSHPQKTWKCRDCPPEKRRDCSLTRQFFSADDCALHRTVFQKAHQIALVAGDSPDTGGGWTTVHSLFGWREGIIAHRGFHRLDATESNAIDTAANDGIE
jgi:hypothetical protein